MCLSLDNNGSCKPKFINNKFSPCNYDNSHIITNGPSEYEYNNENDCINWCRNNKICKQVQISKDFNKTKCVYYDDKKCIDDNTDCIVNDNISLYTMPKTKYNTNIPQQKQNFRPYYLDEKNKFINHFCSNGKGYKGFNCTDNLGEFMGSPYEPYYRHILNGGKMGNLNEKSGTSYTNLVNDSYRENFTNKNNSTNSKYMIYVILFIFVTLIILFLYKKN